MDGIMVHFLDYLRTRCSYLIMVAVSTLLASISVSASSNFRASSSALGDTKRNHCEMDRFVLASPLVVAAEYKDGIVVIATHTSHLYEPLLLGVTDSNAIDSHEEVKKSPQVLPNNYKGPTRIELILTRPTNVNDCSNTLLLCAAGWKIDCMELVDRCRSIVTAQQSRYGIHKQIVSSTNELGKMISSMLSHWLANCYVSESVRSLSCVSLLASCSSQETMSLHFIDCTGSYQVRAFAIGHQSIQVNKKLRGIDLRHHTKEKAIECILQLLTSLDDNDAKMEDTIKPLPQNALFEIATMDATTGLVERMRRKVENIPKLNV